MAIFMVVHRARSGALSVDVFSPKRKTPSKWRVYWTVSPSSVRRLRAVYVTHRQSVHVFQGWSSERVQAYKRYGQEMVARAWAAASLDSLSTSGRTV